MAKREVKGLHKVTSKGHTYWYVGRGRGAPAVKGAYGTTEFWASYDAAIREMHIPEPGRFRSLVTLYRSSPDYEKLAAWTKRKWGPWLDRIADYFNLSIAAFDNSKVRPIIRQWRNTYAATPRSADMGLQVLSRVCAYAVDPLGKLTSNPCLGIKALYSSDRAEIIWTEADITRIKQTCPPELAHVVDLAAATGLRRGDLLRLSWSHVGDDAIIIATGKSGHRREAIIPLYNALRDLLARIPKRSPIVLTNAKGQPWSNDGFGTMFTKAKAAAGIGPELHFHDLRGTAATRFYIAGLPERVIAEILGWEEASVGTIIRKYVDRTAATKAIIRQLNRRLEREQAL
jgi:integrase